MRRGWWIAGIVALCLPLVFASWLMLAAHWKEMDAVTMRMPMGIRSLVAEVALKPFRRDAEGTKRALRVVRLDPASALGWNHVCSYPNRLVSGQSWVESCRTAVRLNPNDSFAHRNLGDAEFDAGRPCDAGQEYARATEIAPQNTWFARSLVEAALRCGDPGTAMIELNRALAKDTQDAKGPAGDPKAKAARSHVANDHQLLSVWFAMNHDASRAYKECTEAIPSVTGSCTCDLTPMGGSRCSGQVMKPNGEPENKAVSFTIQQTAGR